MQVIFSIEERHRICDAFESRFKSSSFYRPNQKDDGRGRFGISVGLKPADMTYFLNRTWLQKDTYGSDKWLKVAQFLGFQRHEHQTWKTSVTAVYTYVQGQLYFAKHNALCGILVDDAGIGKTYAAKEFAATTPNVIYIDGSVYCRKADFIRQLAQKVGVEPNQKLAELESSAIFAIQQMDLPLLIIDEAGDLEATTLLVIKRLYNALEDYCGIIMIGSDGLRSRMERGIEYKKLGYTEVYSRFGKRFSRVLPIHTDDSINEKGELVQGKVSMLKQMAKDIAMANGITSKEDIDIVVAIILNPDKTLADMRGVKRKILGIKRKTQTA